MEFSLRRTYYNRCNPDEPLDPGDERNVDIDEETTEARGIRWVDALAEKIELSDAPATVFFSGLRGTGKSTELRRLAQRLERTDRAHLLPVHINAEDVLDLSATVDVPDILIAIVQGVDTAVLKKEKSSSKPLTESRPQRLWHWLTQTNVAVDSAGVDSSGAQVVLGFKTTPSRRQVMREYVAARMTTFIQMVHQELEELRDRAKKLGYSGIVVLLDSLEKLRGVSTTWRDVLESAESIFKDGAPYLDLPVHVLYTVPPAVLLRVNIPVEFLPMIKLFDRKGKKAEAGFSAAREILRKRIPDNHMNEIFGAQNREHRAAQIIQWSGGYPREMIRLLQICVQKPDLDEALFLRLMGMAGDIYRRTVVESAYPVLAKIAVERADLRIFDEGQRELFDVLLQNNIILRYQNDVTWVDVHPAVKDMAGVQDEIRKLEGKLEQERGSASRKGKD